ncbi:MAG: MinD/ParA family protein [Desulforegulaceae bacterium]|nr:MinD/ParA family protein [Desulforegulaceae bacterium]
MKIITITSGKGGVGKTNIAINLAISLAEKGYKTCLFDADTGLSNVNISMGVVGDHTLEDVISGSKLLKEIIIKNWNKIDIIPGSSGVEQFETLKGKGLANILGQFSSLDEYDYIIVDTGAGISKAVVAFCLASSILIVTIVPDPTSLTDAFSLLKVLELNGLTSQVHLVTNKVKSDYVGEKIYDRFKSTVNKYLSLELDYLASIPKDENIPEAVLRQLPFITLFPNSPASKKILEITDIITGAREKQISAQDTSLGSFIKSYSGFCQSPLKVKNQKDETQGKTGLKKDLVLKKIDLMIRKNNQINKELEDLKKMIKKNQ